MTKSTSEQTAARRICAVQELAWWGVSIKKSSTQYYKEYGSSFMALQIYVYTFLLKLVKMNKTWFHSVDFEHEGKANTLTSNTF